MHDATPTPLLTQDTKGVSILARSLYRQMIAQGYTKEQVIAMSAELIQLVHEDMLRGLDRTLTAE